MNDSYFILFLRALEIYCKQEDNHIYLFIFVVKLGHQDPVFQVLSAKFCHKLLADFDYIFFFFKKLFMVPSIYTNEYNNLADYLWQSVVEKNSEARE